MKLTFHVRFGGGSMEKCHMTKGHTVTRHIPTLHQGQDRPATEWGGGFSPCDETTDRERI